MIVVAGVTIYFILAMRPVLLALLIVWLPVAHALSVWTPLRRVQLRSGRWRCCWPTARC